MDTGLLKYCKEQFYTFQSFTDSCGDDSNDETSNHQFLDWEETEHNGDIIPTEMSNNFYRVYDNGPQSPSHDIFSKHLDWPKLDEVINVDFPIEQNDEDKSEHKNEDSIFDDHTNFDLSTYINDDNPINEIPLTSPKPSQLSSQPATASLTTTKFKAPCKKIDLNSQKYIIENNNKENNDDEDDLVDIETVFDDANQPVLEAFDSFSLLEQFEQSEDPKLAPLDNYEIENKSINNLSKNKKIKNNNFVGGEKKEKLLPKTTSTNISCNNNNNKNNNSNNKQILDSLPQELIQRINESGKRKKITVIDPIPNKKRKQEQKKIQKIEKKQFMPFDHDYCTTLTPYSKEYKKDSGFESCEEDEKNTLRNQPLVKNTDGKLMVSLLKVNTIRNNQKKKLNLEEYKKRRSLPTNSQSNSAGSSTCSSPLPEDENIKRIKHQEKLMKMAADLLKTTPGKNKESIQLTQPILLIDNNEKTVEKVINEISPPPDLEVKTYVSIGCNTNFGEFDVASAKQLDEIKPLLQKVSNKINSNSFITSLIENIPKVKCKNADDKNIETEIVREDKVIYYLKKDRPTKETIDVECQTTISLIDVDNKKSRYRRRDSSCSSSSSQCSSSSYSRHHSSHSSRRSRYSDTESSFSRSRSRSRSPNQTRSFSNTKKYNEEHVRAVEERRVIYVGGIIKGTTKTDLRKRFQGFGKIKNVSLHFRDYGDNYGFVTFANRNDAYKAVEHGNDDVLPKYDLSFGGRRLFCKTSYSDLDDVKEEESNPYASNRVDDIPFEVLLKVTQEKLRKRKT